MPCRTLPIRNRSCGYVSPLRQKNTIFFAVRRKTDDRLFGSGLFDPKVFAAETDTYVKTVGPFGTPLDNRSTYTKSDWILWSCALTDSREKRQALIGPVARFLKETESRYPFSDWYFTDTGLFRAFKGRSVQGGIFMPILTDRGLVFQNAVDE